MKTIRFLEKRATWVALLLTLPAAPIIALAFPRYPVFEGFKKIAANAAKLQPITDLPDLTAEFAKLVDSANIPSYKLNWTFETAFSNLDSNQVYPLAYIPPVAEAVQCTEQRLGGWVKELGKLASRGRADFNGSQFDKVRQNHPAFNNQSFYWILNNARSMAVRFAKLQAAVGDTTSALEYAETAANTCRPLPSIQPQYYGVAYQLCEQLLHSKSNREDIQLIEKKLEDLEIPSFDLTSHMARGAKGYFGRQPGEGTALEPLAMFCLDSVINRFVLRNAAWNLAVREKFTKTENVEWARRLHVTFPQHQYGDENPLPRFAFFPDFPWTVYPALQQQFTHVVRDEPNLLIKNFQSSIFKDLDPVGAAMFFYGVIEAYNNQTRPIETARAAATYRVALQAACAARLFYLDHQRCPHELDELVPTYLKELPTDSSTTTDLALPYINAGKMPYLPLRGMEVPVTKANVGRLLGLQPLMQADQLILNGYLKDLVEATEVETSATSPDHREFKLRINLENGRMENIVPLYGIAQMLKKHPRGIYRDVHIEPRPSTNLTEEQDMLGELVRSPGMRELLQECNTSATQAALESAPNYTMGPVPSYVSAIVEVPRTMYAIVSDGPDQKPDPDHPYLIMNTTRNTDNGPEGDIMVSAEPY